MKASQRLAGLFRVWKWLGEEIIGLIAIIALAFTFFLVMTPLSLLSKLFKKDMLQLKWQPQLSTYRHDHSNETTSNMENQF